MGEGLTLVDDFPSVDPEGVSTASLEKDELLLQVTYLTSSHFTLYDADDDRLRLDVSLEYVPDPGTDEDAFRSTGEISFDPSRDVDEGE